MWAISKYEKELVKALTENNYSFSSIYNHTYRSTFKKEITSISISKINGGINPFYKNVSNMFVLFKQATKYRSVSGMHIPQSGLWKSIV